MEQINLPGVHETNAGSNASVFEISPLFPGYGHTLGNAIRRVLLSSLPGSAVTSVKIDGVDHEFSSVPGVKEDAVELLLNLKTLRVKLIDTNMPATLVLEAKGPGKVYARDFKANSGVEIANPDLFLATLEDKAKLHLEVAVEYGRGFDPVEKRESKSRELGVIAVDSSYGPVQAVSIDVENTRVGKMTNYDRLQINITTDGTISPSDALKSASAILVDQFHFLSAYDTHVAPTEVISEGTTGMVEDSELLATGISARIIAILAQNGYATLQSIKDATDEDLKNVSGLGPKALAEIAKLRA